MKKLCFKRLINEKKKSEKANPDLVLKPINSILNRWHFTFYGPKDHFCSCQSFFFMCGLLKLRVESSLQRLTAGFFHEI